MSANTVEAFIEQKVLLIQQRHNFSLTLGARQIANCADREIIRAYAQLALLLEMADALGLDLEVPYDPSGLDPLGHLEQRVAKRRATQVETQAAARRKPKRQREILV